MNQFQIRTDLALEVRESMEESEEEIRGVRYEEWKDELREIKITKVNIDTRNGAKAMRKPMGTYVTMEAPNLLEEDENYHREISECLAEQLKILIPQSEKEQSVLVVGLGNRDVTADALGSHVVDNLFITRHMILEYGKAAYNQSKIHLISSLEPGVMAKTGMETAEIIKGVVKETKPNLIIVIDALASRSIKRLNRAIQITDTGIQPGSGVGNHRNALTKETLGIPVIAIGVPTVVDAATIVADALERLTKERGEKTHQVCLGESPKTYAELGNMYVTSKDIDAVIKRLGYTLSEGINLALELS